MCALFQAARARRSEAEFQVTNGTLRNWIFAYTANGGRFEANFSMMAPSLMACFHLRFCNTNVVRDGLGRLRIAPEVQREKAIWACDGFSKCTVLDLPQNGSVLYTPNVDTIMVVSLIGCNPCLSDAGLVQRAKYEVRESNQGFRFSHLGFDEALLPVASTVFLVIGVILFVVVSYGFGIVLASDLVLLPGIAHVLYVVILLKIVIYAIHCGSYWNRYQVAWFPVVNVPFEIISRLALDLEILLMCTAIGIIPTTWKVDDTQIKMTLVVGMIVETVNLIMMYAWHVVTYYVFNVFFVAFVGIVILNCRRNIRFFIKYITLVENAKIDATTTPLCRVVRYFWCNALIVTGCFGVKILAWNLVRERRWDVRWLIAELMDLVLIAWYSFCLWWRSDSAFYSDMSNMCNHRLILVNQWKWFLEAGIQPGLDIQAGRYTNPITWQSGDPLPLPNTSLWALQQELQRKFAFDNLRDIDEG